MAWKIFGGIKFGALEIYNAIVVFWAIISGLVYGLGTIILNVASGPLARKLARLWSVHLLSIARVKLVVEGASNIAPHSNYVFVSNHQGYFDIPVLFCSLGSALSFIAKKELFAIPFFGWGMTAIGCISMDRKNPRNARASISRAVSILRTKKLSLVLFPEGTRSPSGRVGEFKRGSFTLALEAGVPVVPVTICGTGAIHGKSSHRIHPGSVTVSIGKPLATGDMMKMTKDELSGTVREIIARTMEKMCP
jgi:1-acyl-sn-glycerol-3-phosphate acyltransferase